MVKSACGIEAVYMCFNGTGIWGGETMCDWAVRTDKAGRQDWESNYQHYIDIGPISFFFVFFKIRYLAENKREKIAFPKYPLLREM